jgi:hypothetical protein
MTFNTVAKIGIGACITGIAVSYLEVSRSHPVMILGLAVVGQALAWMPDFVNRCLDSFNLTAAANQLHVPNEDRGRCLGTLERIPASERAEFVQSLNNLNVRNEDLVDYLDALARTPASERAGFVQSVNNHLANVLVSGQVQPDEDSEDNYDTATFQSDEDSEDMYDVAEIQLPSTLITQDPLALLSLLANEMQNSRSPLKIKYIDSEAIDGGGVSRDFVTKLLDALFKPGIFPTMVPDLKSDLIIPKFSEKISAECYQGLGLIFADALKKEVCTGCRFHSTLFQMLHSLTNEEIDKIDTVHRQEPYNKMLKLYLQSQYSSQQLNEDELNAFINNDTLPPFIKGGVESKEEFLATTGIDEVIRSTLAIARHTKQRLVLRNQSWDEVKGNTPDDLREKIEGKLTKNDVLHALENPSNHTGTVSNQKGWLVRWINDATPTQLENFVYAISGSKALPLGKPLLIQDDADLNHLPIFHTCSYMVNIPCYQDYNTFKDKFERSLVDATKGVMQIF